MYFFNLIMKKLRQACVNLFYILDTKCYRDGKLSILVADKNSRGECVTVTLFYVCVWRDDLTCLSQ